MISEHMHRWVPNSMHVASVTGAAVAVLGATVLVGWYAHFLPLIQVLPSLTPMQRITALTFLLSGSAIILIANGHRRAAAFLAAIPFVLTALTVLEYALGTDLGIDQLLGSAYVTVNTVYPGRMSPITALCLLIVSSALLAVATRALGRFASTVLGIAGALLAAVGTTSFLGYLAGQPAEYGWGNLTHIALHTATGLALLGIGLLAVAWQERPSRESLFYGSRVAPVFQELRVKDAESESAISINDTQTEVFRHTIRVLVTLVLLLAGLLSWQIHQLVSQMGWVNHTDEVIAQEQVLSRYLIDMETGVRGYLLTRNDLFLQPYSDSQPKIDAQLAALYKLTADNPAQQQRLKSIDLLRQEWMQIAAEMLGPTRRDEDGSLDKLQIHGKEVMDRIRSACQAFIDTETELRAGRFRRAQRSIAASLGLAIGLTLSVGLVIAWSNKRQASTLAKFFLRARNEAAEKAALMARHAEREAVAEQIRLSEERIRLFVESVKDYAIFMLDSEGLVLTWNSGAERMKGYSAEEILGRHFSCFYLPEDVARHHPEEELRTAVSEGHFEEEGRRVRKDGSTFWAHVVITPVRDKDGLLQGFAKVTRDITARKEAEEALRESDQLMRTLNERMALGTKIASMGVWEWDLRSNVVIWDDMMFEIYGLAKVVPMPYERWASAVHSDDLPKTEDWLRRVIDERAQEQHEFRILRPDGSVRYIQGASQVVLDDRQEVIRMIGFNLDVTKRKLAEKQLKEQAELLNLAHDAIAVLTLEGKIVFWNIGAQDTYGWSAVEAFGRQVQELLQTKYPVSLATINAILEKQGKWDGELVHVTRAGKSIVVASRWTLQRDDRGIATGILVINRDMTPRNQAEIRLKVREGITSILAESESLAAATPRILRTVSECMQWQVGTLWGVDTQTQLLQYVEGHYTDRHTEEFEQTGKKMKFQRGIGLPGRVWDSGSPAWIDDVAADANFPRAAVAEECGLHGAFAFPILHGAQVLGVLEFFSGESRTCDLETLDMFGSIGSQIGEFVQRKLSELALAVSEERYRNLVESSSALICTHDLEGTILSINPAAVRALGYTLEECVGRSIRDLLVPAATLNFDIYLKAIVRDGAAAGQMPLIDKQGRVRVWLYTNRFMQEEGKATYVLGHAQDITEQLGVHKALQLAQKSALEMEKRLSRSDALTGLANRRAFYESADVERKRAARYSRPLSLAYLDLDNFKQVNDQSGHEAGDQVLVLVADILRKNVRAESVVARLGGDEFALLLPEADHAAASFVIAKLHGLLTKAMQEKNWPVTFSVGMVTYEKPPESTEQMVQAADELMYTVKHEGKNRVASSVITQSESNQWVQ